MIILDSCVISESLKPAPNSKVTSWIASLEEENVFLPALALGELQKGIEILDDGKKRQALRMWFEQLRQRFQGRVLPFDEETAIVWGGLCARLAKKGRPAPVIDGIIAATALRHDALLATRNISDFESSGVKTINPWD
jgi:toxin FitB